MHIFVSEVKCYLFGCRSSTQNQPFKVQSLCSKVLYSMFKCTFSDKRKKKFTQRLCLHLAFEPSQYTQSGLRQFYYILREMLRQYYRIIVYTASSKTI